MSTPFDWGAIINAFLNAVASILQGIASALGTYGTLIGTVLIGMAVGYLAFRGIRRFVPGLSRLLGGIF